ncbi:MAG TPA: adenylate/guanylate cyclase domain-containing protein [Flavobacteriales bacterium]|nr:adenylate/guanylate cyclase domain-containing protein [Flavobacteriales bacterium]HMR27836.1 adenylate/guanylate cyclase domain-containing protein [Flavobacteriales bacterium]
MLRPHLSHALLMLLSCCGAIHLSAQMDKDSLWTVYRNPKATPVQRLHALRDLFDNNAITQQADTFAKYVDVMFTLAQQVGDRTLIASAIMNRGVQFNLESDQDRTDSCYALADSMNGPRGDRLLRAQLCFNRGLSLSKRGLTAQALDKYAEALNLAEALGNELIIRGVKNNMAGLYAQSGDIAKAAELFTDMLQIAEQMKDSSEMGNLLSNIGACHNMMGETEQARPYFRKAAAIFERTRNGNLPRPYYNLASTFTGVEPDSAFHYNSKALAAATSVGDGAMLMGAYQQRSSMLMTAGLPDSAMSCIRMAMDVARSVKNLAMELTVKGTMARMQFEQGNIALAIALEEEVLVGSRELRNVELEKVAAGNLVGYYRKAGRMDRALEMLELQVTLTDSLEREQNQREMIRQEYKYGYEKEALADSLAFAAETAIQQKEVQKQKLMRNGFMGGFTLVALFAGVFLVQRNRISKARKRSDELLLNILPEEVAEELKEKGAADAKRIDMATVLFTDFKGFTAYSENLSPEQLVHDLNECFTAFDNIIAKHGLEKIKTIGDAYMAAGGLPTPNTTHATDVIKAALEIRDFIAEGKARMIAAGLPYFEIRIGIHTGPVVAGIVGVKKFQYDIWGDTVNTASRMESSGEAGQVNISEATYRAVNGEWSMANGGSDHSPTPIRQSPAFTFTPRGKVQAKGKGEMEMYFVQCPATITIKRSEGPVLAGMSVHPI